MNSEFTPIASRLIANNCENSTISASVSRAGLGGAGNPGARAAAIDQPQYSIACTTKVIGIVANSTHPKIALQRLNSSNAPVERMIRAVIGIIAIPKMDRMENQYVNRINGVSGNMPNGAMATNKTAISAYCARCPN